jgi:ketosteroid isomerase-like protein
MTPKETAEAFATLLKAGDHEGAAARFNAANIVSREAMDGPMAVCQGGDAVKAKAEWWYTNHEVHETISEGPLVNGNQFLMKFVIDVTPKATGQRMKMEEWGLYTVADGKIVEERFFYPTM